VATSSGLVVALDNQCRELWARRLASPPVVMKCVTRERTRTAWIVIGCEDGAIAVLDETGRLVRSGKVTGNPVCVDMLDSLSNGPLVLFGTNQGEVKALELDK
jgi:hypothetical protein